MNQTPEYLYQLNHDQETISDVELSKKLGFWGSEKTVNVFLHDVDDEEIELQLVSYCDDGKPGAYFQLVRENGDPLGDVFEEIFVDPQKMAESIEALMNSEKNNLANETTEL